MPKHRPAGNAASSRDRTINNRLPRKRILIVCEGAATEPNYFEALIRSHRLHTVILDDGRQLQIQVDGAARVALSLVNYAEAQQRSGAERFDEIWCVFDKDDFPADAFDNAIAKTRGHKFLKAAWTNEAFELWYILHFDYLNTSPGRDGDKARRYYTERLDKLLQQHFGKAKYTKNDVNMYDLLGSMRLQKAITNAEKLLKEYDDALPCHRKQPATMVHELVKNLLQYSTETL